MYLDFDFVVKNVSSKTVAVRFYYEAGIEFDENQYYVTQAEPYVLGSAFDAVTFPESLAPNETYSYNFCITCFKDFGYATFFFAKNYSSVKDRACSVKITSDLPSHYMVYDQRTGAEATSSSSISE